MPPLFAHFRSDPDEFRSAALNRLDRVDVIHVKCVEISFEIDRPLYAVAQEFEQFGAQAAPLNLLAIHEEAAVRAHIYGKCFLPRTFVPKDDLVTSKTHEQAMGRQRPNNHEDSHQNPQNGTAK